MKIQRFIEDIPYVFGVLRRDGLKKFFVRVYWYLRGKRFLDEPLKFSKSMVESGDTVISISCDFCKILSDEIELFGCIISRKGIKKIEIFVDDESIGEAGLTPDEKKDYFYFYKKMEIKKNKKTHLVIRVTDNDNLVFSIERELSLEASGKEGQIITEGNNLPAVKREIHGNPKASIIILTSNKNPDLLDNCLKSIKKSTYNNYEIIVFTDKRKFNYSKFTNLAVQKAAGDYLVFLNDDTEVISPDWVQEMLFFAQMPNVGVVGAKLLYPNRTIQHAGIALIDDEIGSFHVGRFYPPNSESLGGLLNVARKCSAVTFACAMVKKDIFEKLDGLDEDYEMLCCDVDFCLRANDLGYSTVWTPSAVLYHKEATSRGSICYKTDIEKFRKRWRPKSFS